MTKKELYDKFLKIFPNFKSQIKSYRQYDDRALKIYTKTGGAFIFELDKNGSDFSLRHA